MRSDDTNRSCEGCNYEAFDLNTIKEAKFILYFKEMSHVTYSLSMLIHLVSYLNLCGKRARLVTYVRGNDFMAAYSDMQLLNSRIVNSDEYIIDNTTLEIPFITSDTDNTVIRALLKSDCDVLIIFDRLLWDEDLIKGRTVFKYRMAGGLKQLKLLEASLGTTFDSSTTFIEEENDDYVYIPHIQEFGGKKNRIMGTAQYVATAIHQHGKRYNLLDYILEQCGIRNDIN